MIETSDDYQSVPGAPDNMSSASGSGLTEQDRITGPKLLRLRQYKDDARNQFTAMTDKELLEATTYLGDPSGKDV